ncbi:MULTISPECIES: DUF3300 domain-containing protein [Delftia]|uniref:DUF3300 domain-containing protein n=1 Tax=Delftia TaxID=80865 RepID=UPI000F84AEA0|nr:MULTISPECIES: DUF3300 domain-containing protein [Delftia]WEM00614.1 DUF3300 domain-containing protein [Delftia tsuruhatensis]WQM81227.1 DUF3300 domain-containing protein [Delftia tsuruhatensis]
MLQSAVPRARTMAPSASHAGALRLSVLGLAAALALSACNESQDKPPQAASVPLPPATESAQPVATPVAYVPPSAETLYQMVAPIALYPDKLVAQVLAASTYPEQVGAAEVWLGQNPGLKPQELQDAVNGQDWDPSVKSLAQFPNVLAQLSSNIPWTTALGRAYYNDPADVMNAIQVMRQRAYKAGTLKDSSRLKVAVATADAPPPVPQPAPQAVGEPLSSMLPVPVIDTPPQFIEIAPAQPDTVYVPQYDPGVVYGEPVPMYGGYRPIVAPQPVYVGSSAAPVVAGLIGFGAGVILAESVDRRPWGWNSWGMRWGEPGYRWHRNEPPPPPSRRPAVIYNNNTYVSRSTTVVQNIHNTRINNVGDVTHIANNPHFEPRRPDFPQQGGDPRSGDPRSGDPRSGDPRSGGMAAAALAGAAGMAGAAAAAHSGMPQRLGLRPPQGGPPPSAQGMVPPGGAQGFARHDGADRGRPGLTPDDRPQASLQPRMNPVPASQPGQFGKWPQSPQSAQSAPSSPSGTAQRPAPALPAAAMQGDRGRDSRVPSWSSAATQQGMRPQDRQDRDRSMADAARQRQQQQQQMETQAARLRGEEQARQQQQRQAQVQAQAQARQQAERDRQALQQRSQDQARQQQMQQQQQQQARAQEQMQARMQAQQQAQQQAQRQAQMQERQAQQQRQQQFEAAQQQRMQAQQAQQAQAQARAQQQQARAQQEQRQQQQRMANAARPQERRGGRDERRDR